MITGPPDIYFDIDNKNVLLSIATFCLFAH